MSHSRLLRVPRRMIGGALCLVAFAVPVYLFIRTDTPQVPPQLPVPSVALSVTLGDIRLTQIPSYKNAVPVLVYHDISERSGRYAVSPRVFAEQMAALKTEGFHAISAAEVVAFLDGHGSLPARPFLLTFDDGLGSAWRAADPILARYGFRAISFVITGQLGEHGFYYLHPSELRAMADSGRWDIEAHTHLAHQYAQVDSAGDYGPPLTNRLWLAGQHRLETESEFAARIKHDLDLNVRELKQYGSNPQLFAYPFSAARTPTNDPHLIPILHQLVSARFRASFTSTDGTARHPRSCRGSRSTTPRPPPRSSPD